MNEHSHQLSDGQLICDNEQCRRQSLEKIQEINRKIEDDFERIVQSNQINSNEGWSIMCLLSKELSDRLISAFNKREIGDVIETYMKQKKTKQAFEKVFHHEKWISKKELWNLYTKMSEDAVFVLSKAKQERRKHRARFHVLEEN